jgi:transcriptional regulator with XRE-family HTH domain
VKTSLPSTDDEAIEIRAGRRIKELRTANRLTIQALADIAGISKPLLSKIENGKVGSPISTYARIARALHADIGDLLRYEEAVNFLVVRKNDPKPSPRRKIPHGYSFELLGERWPAKKWHSYILTYSPADSAGELPSFTHEGEEFLLVLEGELEFHFMEQKVTLQTGDCVFLDGSFPHGGRATGENKCVALMIETPR